MLSSRPEVHTTSTNDIEAQRHPSNASENTLEKAVQVALQDDEPLWPTDYRAYVAALGGFFLMFNSWGIVNAYGTFLSFYEEELLSNTTLEVLNLVGSTQCFIVLLASLPVGRLLDAGFHVHLKATGSILVPLAHLLISFTSGTGTRNAGSTSTIWALQGLLAGVGMACFFVTSSQVVATWFKKKKGFAIGFVASGASVSGLVYPFMLRFMMPKVGFNAAVRYISLVIFLTCVLALCLQWPKPTHPLRPLKLKAEPSDAAESTHHHQHHHHLHLHLHHRPRAPPQPITSLRTWVDPSALRHPSFVLFSAAIAMMFLGFYGVFFNLEEWAAQKRIAYKGTTPPPCPDDQPTCITPGLRTYYLLAIMNASSSLGRLTSSFFCDIFGAVRVHSFVTFVCSLLCLILWTLTTSDKGALAFVILFGAFSGAVIGLPPASMAAILGPHHQAKLGQWTGMMYCFAAPCALIGPVIEGYLVKTYGWNDHIIQLFSGTCLFLSALFMAAATWAQSEEDWHQVKHKTGAALRRLRPGAAANADRSYSDAPLSTAVTICESPPNGKAITREKELA